MRNKSGDITKRPAVAIRTELRDMNENIFNVYSITCNIFSREMMKCYIPFQISNEIILGTDIKNILGNAATKKKTIENREQVRKSNFN
jgi:hypothetical protein